MSDVFVSSETQLVQDVKKEKIESSEDELEKEEKLRQKDIKERDEFATRVKDRDKEKTRKIMSKSEQKVWISVCMTDRIDQ